MNTKVTLTGIELDFPLYNGSGSFEYGDYQWTNIDFKNIPVLVLKTSTIKSKITPEKRQNLMSTKGTQIFNSIGLQNPPIEGVVAKIAEFKQKYNMPLIASASGDTVAEFAENVKILSEQDVVAVEINLSCPNVDKGGITYGTDPKLVEEVVRAVKKASKKPVHVKLTPNVTDIVSIGLAAERGGADALIAINTLLGFVCDPQTGEPIISRGYGGYSGPGIFPVALRAVHQLYKAVSIPIIGVGGVTSTQDFIDMLSAGATAVQIVSGTKDNPAIFKKIKKELPKRMKQMGVTDIQELIGRSHKFELRDLFPGSYTNTVGPETQKASKNASCGADCQDESCAAPKANAKKVPTSKIATKAPEVKKAVKEEVAAKASKTEAKPVVKTAATKATPAKTSATKATAVKPSTTKAAPKATVAKTTTAKAAPKKAPAAKGKNGK